MRISDFVQRQITQIAPRKKSARTEEKRSKGYLFRFRSALKKASGGKHGSQLDEASEIPSLDQLIPTGQRSFGVGVLFGKFIEPFARDDVHGGFVSLAPRARLCKNAPVQFVGLLIANRHKPRACP